MIRVIKEVYGLDSPKVAKVMFQVPRHEFVSRIYRQIAYSDRPVPIGAGQTMSQPYTVAFMTHLLIGERDTRYERILEIGTGSGYQAAVLSKLVKEVYTVEIVDKLAKRVGKALKKLRYNNVFVKTGNGAKGWKEKAPFDAIMVTAGLKEIPQELFNQLEVGGVLIAPEGRGDDKQMTRYKKLKKGRTKKEEFGTFHFVPFVWE